MRKGLVKVRSYTRECWLQAFTIEANNDVTCLLNTIQQYNITSRLPGFAREEGGEGGRGGVGGRLVGREGGMEGGREGREGGREGWRKGREGGRRGGRK